MASDMTKPAITLHDISRRCGVSISTVSGVLNGRDDFAEHTKRKVWSAANDLGYSPSLEARHLRAGNRSVHTPSRILFHISHLGSLQSPENDPLELRRSMLLTVSAARHGYLMADYFYHMQAGFRCYPYLNNHFDGAIIGSPHADVIKAVKKKIPVVMMDIPKMAGHFGIPSVNMDFMSGIMKVMEELSRRGHTRASLIYSQAPASSWLEEKLVMYTDMLASKYGVSIVESARYPLENLTEITHNTLLDEVAMHLIPQLRSGAVNAVISVHYAYINTLHDIFQDAGIEAGQYSGIALNAPESGVFPFEAICYDWPKLTDKAVSILIAQIEQKNMGDNDFECLIPMVANFNRASFQ